MTSVPTVPATAFTGNAARNDVIRQVRCSVAALKSDPSILDMTRGGVLLETGTLLPIGSQHLCQLRLAGQAIFLPGRVTHTRYQKEDGGPAVFHVGLTFRLLSDHHKAALERLTSLLGLRALLAESAERT
jgi:hypothetical protein